MNQADSHFDFLGYRFKRSRRGGSGRGRGRDHHRWPNRYITGLGLLCLLDAKAAETASLRQGANH